MELLVLLVLILLNGVFAMSEMAVVAARRSRLQQWVDEGRAGASDALALANEQGHFLSTIQVGITVIGVLTGAIGGATVAQQLEESLAATPWLRPHASAVALAIVVAGITVASVVLGELVPKRIALLNPEGVASVLARPMRLLSQLAFPAVRALALLTEGVLRFLGVRMSGERPVSQEEINVLMEQGAEAGVFEKHEQALVSRVFRMDQQRIWSAMTPRADIVYFDLDDAFDVNRRKLLDSGHSRFVVCRGGLGDIVGIVRAKTLLDDAYEGKPADLTSGIVAPFYVPGTLTLIGLLETFTKHRQHLALVLDEYGELQGLVTMNDVMEALIGEVATVEDGEAPDIVRRADGSWLVDGNVAPARFREAMLLEQRLPAEDTASYHTLGGFAMMRLGRIPRVGDRFESCGFRFEIVDMDRNRVDKLLVTQVGPQGPVAAASGQG